MSSKLLINEHPLMLLPSLAKAIGLNEALILQQIHYWIDPRINKNFHHKKYWVYNSYQKWHLQFPFFSERTLRRAINSLEEKELIISGYFNKTAFDKTKWYTINYSKLKTLELESSRSGQNGQIDEDSFSNSICSNGPDDDANVDSSYNTETTTENTTDTQRESKMISSFIDLWNATIPFNITLTPSRRTRLLEVCKSCFQSDIDNWQKFLDTILESKFLMGKVTDFKVSFDWAIKEDNIYRILEGAYSNNKVEKADDGDIEQKVDNFIFSLTNNTWKHVCMKAKEKYGAAILYSWFKDLRVIEEDSDSITISATTKFKLDYIKMHYLSFIEKTVQNVKQNQNTQIRLICK